MTVISVTLGRAFHYLDDLIPATQFPLDDLAAVVLLVYFGVSTLADAASMEGSTEKEDAELAIAGIGNGNLGFQAAAATFALVFVAEWGDKSFFSTIAPFFKVSVKLGQPVPESNFWVVEKSGSPLITST